MNRTFWYLIALLLSFCVDSFGFTKYVTHNLNLRYEPNAHSYVLTVIPKGTAVTIEEDCTCLWVPVEYNGCKYVNVSIKDEDYNVEYNLFEFEI